MPDCGRIDTSLGPASGCVLLVVLLARFGTARSNAAHARAATWVRHVQETALLVFRILVRIADLQQMAVAEWLQSFNSLRGPMERLGII